MCTASSAPAPPALRRAARSLPERANPALHLELGQAVAAELEARRWRDAGRILDVLSPLAGGVHVDDPWSEYDIVRASFLLASDKLDEFDAALEDVARE